MYECAICTYYKINMYKCKKRIDMYILQCYYKFKVQNRDNRVQ